MGLKRRFALTILVVFLAANIVSLFSLSIIADGAIARLGASLAEQQALGARDHSLTPLVGEIAMARKLADSPLLQDWAQHEDAHSLKTLAMAEMASYRRSFASGSYFLALTGSGHYYYGDGSPNDGPHYTLDPAKPEDAWFAATIREGRDVQINVNPDLHLGVTKVWINVLMRKDGRVIGVVGTGLDLSQFIREAVQSGTTDADTILVNAEGDIQASKDTARIDYASLTKAPSDHTTVLALLDRETERTRLRAAIASGVAQPFTTEIGGHRQIMYLAPMREIGWCAISMVDRDHLMRQNWVLDIAALLVMTTVITLAVMLFLLDHWVLSRIAKLDASTEDMALGNYVAPAITGPRDEIGRLATHFGLMADRVARHTLDLERSLAAQAAETDTATALRTESEERFRSLVEATTDWVWETDDQNRFTWVSPSIEAATGTTPQSLLGRWCWDIASPNRSIDTAAWERFISGLGIRQPFRDFRFWLQAPDGGDRWVSISGSPCFDDDRFIGYRGVGSDITNDARQALRLRMLSATVEQIPVSVVITDPRGAIEYVNAKCLEITGYEAQELIGNRPRVFASGLTPIATYAEMWRTISGGQSWVGELRNRRRNGELYWESVRISPVIDDEGNVAHYVSIKEDETFRKIAEERLAAANRALEDQAVLLTRSNAELEQFAYVASHDLRQPLRMISSYLSLIRKRLGNPIDPDLDTYIGFAHDGAKRLDKLILGLLEYSRIGRNNDSSFSPVALTEVVADAILNLEIAIQEAGARITSAADLPWVFGDRSELTRLFQNLVANAIKYVPPGRTPHVEIGWRRSKDADQKDVLLVWVQDNGIGIQPQDRDRAFGVFQRLVTADQYEGTGIGLAVCKKIVENHQGYIWIENPDPAPDADGVGTRFVIAFTR